MSHTHNPHTNKITTDFHKRIKQVDSFFLQVKKCCLKGEILLKPIFSWNWVKMCGMKKALKYSRDSRHADQTSLHRINWTFCQFCVNISKKGGEDDRANFSGILVPAGRLHPKNLLTYRRWLLLHKDHWSQPMCVTLETRTKSTELSSKLWDSEEKGQKVNSCTCTCKGRHHK